VSVANPDKRKLSQLSFYILCVESVRAFRPNPVKYLSFTSTVLAIFTAPIMTPRAVYARYRGAWRTVPLFLYNDDAGRLARWGCTRGTQPLVATQRVAHFLYL